MASSSTSASTCVYDIFINHRGPDCKKTLATYLYDRLSKHGLRVFLDQRELQEGDPFPSQIEGAIRTASVHIAIFSPRYAESVWCLKELVLMLESNKTIIPVFYGVQPSELRWTQRETGLYDTVLRMFPWVRCMLCSTRDENGVYARSLSYLQEKKPRYDSNIIAKWREALSHVANISGFDMETYNGDEQQLLEKVVEEVLKRFPRKLHVSKYPIALDQKVQDFEREMYFQRQSEETRVMGIVGLGGVGKTTLAKEFFNRQVSNYNRSCFLSDVRDKPLNSLQSMLLKDLAQWNGQINSSDEGIEILRKYLSSCKALIILDDVDHIQQIDALLLPVKDVLQPGSLILATSRNKDVLKSAGIVESSIYKLTGLDRQHSKELFCSHAFQQSHPDEGFEQVVEEFLNACDGLPLSLMVLGAHLHGKNDLKYWEAQLRKISKALPMDIQKRLKVSYDGLDEEEKQIFLDVACFFIGEDRDTAIRIWDGSGWEGELGFLNLENKCLLGVDKQNRITMHDHLRDMGRDLAEKEPPHCQRRLWRPTYNLSDQSHVRGINMVPEWPPRLFEKLAEHMSSVQLVRAEGDSVQSIFSAAQTPQLIWLRWDKFPYPSLPSWIPLENLRVLQIKGDKFEMIWTHESQVPVQIKELHIHSLVPNIPKSIGMLKHLEKLVLGTEKYDNTGLRTLPEEFGDLESLKYLELSGYSGIECLPESFGKLTNLQTINLSNCSSLQALPDSFGNLVNLQTIDLSYCSHLQMLPDSFGNLVNLQTIHLYFCSSLQMLPDSFGNLVNLQTIHLHFCFSLQMLPDSFGNLVNLQTIRLSHCSTLQMLPDSFGNLMNLQTICLSDFSTLQMLPDSFGNLVNLQTIDLSHCSSLQMLPDSFGNLVNLQTIRLSHCSSVQMLPDSGNLVNLQTIDLSHCSSLQMLPDSFGNLVNLQTIDLSGCSHVQMLPDSFGNLVNLQTIDLSCCSHLQMLPDSFVNLVNLQTIDLSCCSHLQMLPDSFGNLVNLQTIRLDSCYHLQLPDSFGNLVNLQTIRLDSCYHLQMLPDSFGNLVNLQTIRLSGCSHLQMLPDSFGNLVNLQTIHLSCCSHLQMLPDSFGNLVNLQTVNLSHCSLLQMLPDSFGNLVNLQTVNLSHCSLLQMFPDSFRNLVNLQTVDLSGCSHLQMLPDSLGNLANLQTIDLSGCSHLQMLPVSFSNLLPNLRSMKLLDTGLKELPSALEYFSNLKILHLGSKSLEILSFSFPRSLEELELHFCHGFKCLPDSIRRLTQLRKLIIKEINTLEVFKIEDCQPSDPPFIKDGAEIETFSNSRVASEVSYSEDVFPNLQHVEIVDCNSLAEVGALPTTVITLDLRGCGALRKVGGLCSLSKLQNLYICGSMELEELLSTESLVLQHVELRDCNALVEVGSLPTTLLTLSLRGCGALKKIGELCGLSKLLQLDISGCMELEELPSIETLVSLVSLNANGCVKLKRIRGLLQCRQLRHLNVSGCSGLEEVEGVEHCTWLRRIDVSGCHKLQCPVSLTI